MTRRKERRNEPTDTGDTRPPTLYFIRDKEHLDHVATSFHTRCATPILDRIAGLFHGIHAEDLADVYNNGFLALYRWLGKQVAEGKPVYLEGDEQDGWHQDGWLQVGYNFFAYPTIRLLHRTLRQRTVQLPTIEDSETDLAFEPEANEFPADTGLVTCELRGLLTETFDNAGLTVLEMTVWQTFFTNIDELYGAWSIFEPLSLLIAQDHNIDIKPETIRKAWRSGRTKLLRYLKSRDKPDVRDLIRETDRGRSRHRKPKPEPTGAQPSQPQTSPPDTREVGSRQATHRRPSGEGQGATQARTGEE